MSSYVDKLTELAEVKWAQMSGRFSDGEQAQRAELPSKVAYVVLWALGTILDEKLDEHDLDIEWLQDHVAELQDPDLWEDVDDAMLVTDED